MNAMKFTEIYAASAREAMRQARGASLAARL